MFHCLQCYGFQHKNLKLNGNLPQINAVQGFVDECLLFSILEIFDSLPEETSS